jgi:pimeloyl-ACP methyl ester carboxylesterase
MIPLGTLILNSWATRRASLPPSHPAHSKGLIAVTFDQRNHGTREVHPPANGSWRDGNESHAQDMFGVIHGTGLDTSLLMDHIGSYIFQDLGREIPIEQHLTLGISLGGHAAWQIFFSERRIEAAVVIIGCPDYMRKSRFISNGQPEGRNSYIAKLLSCNSARECISWRNFNSQMFIWPSKWRA